MELDRQMLQQLMNMNDEALRARNVVKNSNDRTTIFRDLGYVGGCTISIETSFASARS